MTTEEKEAKKFSFFEVENMMHHLGFANRRMLIALIVVCVTFIVVIFGYTEREKNWINTYTELTDRLTAMVEVASNGVHEQSGP